MTYLTRLLLLGVFVTSATRLHAQSPEPVHVTHDSLTLDFVDADLRSVMQSLSRYLPKPLLFTNVPPVRVSLQTPGPVSRDDVRDLLRGLLEGQNLELVEEPAYLRIRERSAPPSMAPMIQPDSVRQQAAANAAPRLYVVRLRHARAADVAAAVNQLFGGSGQFSGSAGLSTGTLTDELRRMNAPPAAPSPGAGSPQGTGASLAGPVTIVPDEISNSLLVRANATDYALIHQAVDELDIRPLQVLIEVLIVEARRDHTFSLGADLFTPDQSINHHGATLGGDLIGGGLGDLVIQVMNLGGPNLYATIRAAESRGNVSILSRPVLLASNNTEAKLLVGSQRPFVQVSRSLPTDTPSRDQVVQYRDVGTRLTIKPTINHDGYVSLQIQQEVSAATSETQFDAPIISTREASTRVLLRNGQTVVLGGLRDQQSDRSRRGIPFFSQLPIIGGLFGSDDRHDDSTEFYLFLTPRILTTDADADSVTAPRLPRGEPR
jgi:general secretion pathway protein D